MRDRNEWFKEVERAYLNIELKTANRPYETERRARALERDRARALKRSRKAKR